MTDNDHVSRDEAAATLLTRQNFSTGLPNKPAVTDESPTDAADILTDEQRRAAQLRAHFSTS